MQLKFFQIPAYEADEVSEELNKFLRSHRIITVDRHFVDQGAHSVWAICVSYLEMNTRAPSAKRGKIDYRERLSESDFAIYAKLRELRKRLALEEGVPPYALFTNEQLATMVESRASSLADLSNIQGVGEAKLEKHGDAFLAILSQPHQKQPLSNGIEAHEA